MKNPDSAMIFGYAHAKDGPMYFHWVQLRYTNPEGKYVYYTSRSNERGLFYAENLPFGEYEISRIGNDNGNRVVWNLGEGSKDTQMTIKKSGITYFGSFQFTYIESESFFGRDSFDFQRASTPSEKELLQKLTKYTKKTQWDAGIQKRLKNLK